MFEQSQIAQDEIDVLLEKNESHYLDFKGKSISGKSLQRHIVGFANADGGELYIGIEEVNEIFEISGFDVVEDANQLIHDSIIGIKPSVESMVVEFLETPAKKIIVRFIIPKSPKIHYTDSGDCYVRLSAQSQKIKGEEVVKLAYSKGFFKYEEQQVDSSSVDDIIEVGFLQEYLERIGSRQDANRFLRRNRLLSHEDQKKVNVGCILLFDEDPDEVLSTKASVKIMRMKTDAAEYNRGQLAFHEKLSGPLESLVSETEERILEIMSDASFVVDGVEFKISYPMEAVHEVLVNAFLHRDYSISDEIQIGIYDNRIEIRSPGKLPGSVTIENILNAHFARNPNVVRLINKLPKPLNHDLGEGLDTAFRAMNTAGLVPPNIVEADNSVVVTLLHKKIASYEELIMKYLEGNEWVTNKIARGLTGEGSENKVKKALQRLRKMNLIELEDPNASRFKYRYRKVKG